MTVVYVIGVTRTADGITTGMDLYFSTEGVLVNEVTNAADDGYEDYIPEKLRRVSNSRFKVTSMITAEAR